uniref:Uncharacterized protein n=1 Tax=Anguilla anguilla TaxID=7936 RepID=A0A0E9P9G8_ANGAN
MVVCLTKGGTVLSEKKTPD